MSFTFIHTADWQIGKRFGGFDAHLAGRLQEARLDAIDRIAAAASAHGARHVLVAGDVYDAPDLAERTLRQALTRMGQHRDLVWVLLPGNHDPGGAGSVWARVRQIVGASRHVIIADKPEPVTLAQGIDVLPAPLTAKATLRDPTAWMDSASNGDAHLRIGLAHGAVHGFGSSGESQIPIDAGRVERARLDYLALGDWHGMKQVSERCWYSGTPEPDNFANNPKGQVLAVTLERQGPGRRAAVNVRAVTTGHYAWARVERPITSGADIALLDKEIAALSQPQSRLLVSLRLSGSLSLAEHGLLEHLRADLDARLQYLDWRDHAVALSGDVDASDMEALAGSDGELRKVATRLGALAREDAGETREGGGAAPAPAVARTALLRLMALARAAGEGA